MPFIYTIDDFNGGKNTTVSDRKIADNEMVDVINFQPDPIGALSVRYGKVKYNTSAFTSLDTYDSSIAYMTVFSKTDSTSYFVAFCVSNDADSSNATGHSYNAATGANIMTRKTAASAESPRPYAFSRSMKVIGTVTTPSATGVSFVSRRDNTVSWTIYDTDVITADHLGDTLLACNGRDRPIYWTGPSLGDFASAGTGAPNEAQVCKAWRNYMFIGNYENYPFRLRWSEVDDPLTWPSSNYLDLDYQDEIMGIAGYGDTILVFMKRSIWAIEWQGSVLQFQKRRVVSGIGCVAPNSAITIGNAVYFLSNRKLIEKFEGGSVSPVGFKIKKDLAKINSTYSKLAQSAFDYDNSRLWVTVPTGDYSRGNCVFMYDFILESWFQYGGLTYDEDADSDFDSSSIMVYRVSDRDNVIFVGGTDGYIYRYTDSETDDDGTAFTSYLRTKWIHPGSPATRYAAAIPVNYVRLLKLRFLVKPVSGGEMAVTVRYDHDRSENESTTLSLTAPTARSTATRKFVDFDLTRTCQSFKIDLSSSAAGFAIYEIHAYYEPKGDVLLT